MPATVPSLGRPADRKNSILQHFRQKIAEGEWQPGVQLPTRSEIGELFGASPVTVQSALEHLRRDGFIVVNGRHGTYVAPDPPHLTNYALVFPSEPTSLGWVRFWSALMNEAVIIERTQGRRIPVYYNIETGHDSEDLHKLNREVRAHRLAGVIFATGPYQIELADSSIPQVAIVPKTPAMPVAQVCLDDDSFWDKAIHYLRERGHKKVALLTPPYQPHIIEAYVERLRSAGLILEPQWVQRVHQMAPDTAHNVMHLLMHPAQTSRPDALIISDDNLVEHGVAGLLTAGVRIPHDMEVVSHCNFPLVTPSVVPIKRLGFDVRKVLQSCLDSIDAQRQGQSVAHYTPIYAQFENEVN